MPGARKSARRALARAVFPATGILAAICLAAQLPATSAAAATAPPVKWSPRLGPVPGAKTSTAPALADVRLGTHRSDLFLFWTAPSDPPGFKISYARSISLRKDTWSAPAQVLSGKVRTRSRPAAAPIGSATSGQVIVVWRDAASSRILYSIGHEDKGGVLRWLGVQAVPGAASSVGPAVLQPLHSDAIVVTWRGAGGAVDDIVGFPSASGLVKWATGGAIPLATTASTPAIAEVSTGSESGRIFAVWQVPGSTGRVQFAIAADTAQGALKWSVPRALPPAVSTGAAPSAIAIGQDSAFPLLVVYRARHGSALSYVTLASGGRVAGPFSVPHIRSFNGTAISPGLLAAEDPGDVFYEPFVRVCAGCRAVTPGSR
ncbi:MAG TPA: hypothetical protein VFQ44_06515 [Streptosporangiaceae bacterium]|nr:hypothetical protein [Streptosporangiaceae bacterium]